MIRQDSQPRSRTVALRRKAMVSVPPIIELGPGPSDCPLAPDWPGRLRPLRFEFSSPDQESFLRAAYQANLGEKLSVIEAQWTVAADDHTGETPAYGSNLFPGFPCHIHTEFIVDGQRVHIDRTWANYGGPGRLKVEWHIHVDGLLAGFGGEMGCSLGLTVSIQPTVALVNNARAIVIPWRSLWHRIKLQDVLLEPDEIALYVVRVGAT